jgi:hypothetical protein
MHHTSKSIRTVQYLKNMRLKGKREMKKQKHLVVCTWCWSAFQKLSQQTILHYSDRMLPSGHNAYELAITLSLCHSSHIYQIPPT